MGCEIILDGPHLRLRGYQMRRKLRADMHCNSGDNRAQCRPIAAYFQVARAKLEGRGKANVRLGGLSASQRPRDFRLRQQRGQETGRVCVAHAELEKFEGYCGWLDRGNLSSGVELEFR
jgi:hypothetical protein